MQRQIDIFIEPKDAFTVSGDVLALKYADRFYGIDAAAAEKLIQKGIDIRSQMPRQGGSRIFDTGSTMAVAHVLFVGVGYLYEFQYKEIREFSRLVLASLSVSKARIRRLVVTLHGPGYGLDEVEAFESEIAGFIDGVTAGDYPKSLETIVIAERNLSRAQRLQASLDELLPNGRIAISGFSGSKTLDQRASDRLRDVGYESSSKAHVFVAMPFAEEMDDVYHYGIQGAVKAAGFLCERADLSSFTGDVMTWVKQRIDSATLIIADLTGANANVYLEVGYAWGCKRPTVLLVRDTKDLKFDVRGQRCLHYKKSKILNNCFNKNWNNLSSQHCDQKS
ncbi:MAG: hypothetical protein ACFB14_19375 [Leptolyngbyaceae cyanobacterium]